MNNPHALLTALAILRVNIEADNNNYLTNFIPFIVDGMRSLHREELSETALSAHINRKFGITVPPGVIGHLLEMMTTRGIVTKRSDDALELSDSLNDGDMNLKVREFERRSTAFITKFIDHVRPVHPTLDRTEAAEHLIDFVKVHGIGLLATEYGTRTTEVELAPASDIGYLMAKYVQVCLSEDSDSAEYILDLVKASMISTSLFYSSGMIDESLNEVVIVLDSKVLMRALGLSGPALRDCTLPTIKLCTSVGAQVATFLHIIEEINGILSAIANSMEIQRSPDQIREVELHLLNQEISHLDVRYIADTLAERVRDLGVAIIDTPPYEDPTSVDEDRLDGELRKDMPNLNDIARSRDLLSLAAVHRMRNGAKYDHLEDCKAILATTSSGLRRVAKRFFRTANSVPLAISDSHLQTFAWLKQPLDLPRVPRLATLGHCHAAIQPSDKLWRKYLKTIDSLAESEQYSEAQLTWLRFSEVARECLTDRTLNSPEKLNQETLTELLEKNSQDAAAPIRAELQSAHAKLASMQEAHLELARRLDASEDRAKRTEESLREAELKLRRKSRYDLRTHVATPKKDDSKTEDSTRHNTPEGDEGAASSKYLDAEKLAIQIAYFLSRVVITPILIIVLLITLYAVLAASPLANELPVQIPSPWNYVLIILGILVQFVSLTNGFTFHKGKIVATRRLQTWILKKLDDSPAEAS